MDYVVNPSFFYWLQVIDCVNVLLWSLIWCCICLMVCVYWPFMCSRINNLGNYDEEAKQILNKKIIKHIKLSVCFVVFVSVLLVFFPKKETIIQMAIAQNITYSNLQKAKNEIANDAKGIIDYLFTKFQKPAEEKK